MRCDSGAGRCPPEGNSTIVWARDARVYSIRQLFLVLFVLLGLGACA
jgi:hypothetical protein